MESLISFGSAYIIVYLCINNTWISQVLTQEIGCHNGYCYYYHPERVDWLEANQLCIDSGEILAETIPTQAISNEDSSPWSGPFWINSDTSNVVTATGEALFSCQYVDGDGTKSAACYMKKNYVCQTAYPRECLLSKSGHEYKGTTDYYSPGNTCQIWSNGPQIDEWVFADGSIDSASNHCRNPDNSISVWCYENSENFRYCNVSNCLAVQSDCFSSYLSKDQVSCFGSDCAVIITEPQNWLTARKCCSNIGGRLLTDTTLSILNALNIDSEIWVNSSSLNLPVTDGTITCPYIATLDETPPSFGDCADKKRFVCRKVHVTTSTITVPTTTTTTTTTPSTTLRTSPSYSPSTLSSTMSTSPTSSIVTSASAPVSTGASKKSSGIDNEIIYIIVVVLVVLVAFVLITSIVCVKRKKRKSQKKSKETPVMQENEMYQTSAIGTSSEYRNATFTGTPSEYTNAGYKDSSFSFNAGPPDYDTTAQQKYVNTRTPSELNAVYDQAEYVYTKGDISQPSHSQDEGTYANSELDYTGGSLHPLTNPVYGISRADSDSIYSQPTKSIKRDQSNKRNTMSPITEGVYAVNPPNLPKRNY